MSSSSSFQWHTPLASRLGYSVVVVVVIWGKYRLRIREEKGHETNETKIISISI